MGTSGTSIFADDVACDVRDEFRELIGEGLSSKDATRALIDSCADWIDDADDGPTFWIALAATQWKLGRLEDDVKTQALKRIESGADLTKWETPALRKKRSEVLQRLKKQLESPQPPPKKVPKKFIDRCDWNRGEVFAYERKAGDFVAFRVVGLFQGDGAWVEVGSLSPVIEVFDWTGMNIPDASEFATLSLRRDTNGHSRSVLWRMSERDTKLKRFKRLNIILEPTQQLATPEKINETCGSIYAGVFER